MNCWLNTFIIYFKRRNWYNYAKSVRGPKMCRKRWVPLRQWIHPKSYFVHELWKIIEMMLKMIFYLYFQKPIIKIQLLHAYYLALLRVHCTIYFCPSETSIRQPPLYNSQFLLVPKVAVLYTVTGLTVFHLHLPMTLGRLK